LTIESAEREGWLKPAGPSGSDSRETPGIGLAIVAAVRGYKCISYDRQSFAEKSRYLSTGADVVITRFPPNRARPIITFRRRDGLRQKPELVLSITASHNPEAHYRTTGPEPGSRRGKDHAFYSGIGTGGTISGTGRYLKERDPKIKIIGADPVGLDLQDLQGNG
jgi:cystathionine beta-synthase